MKGRKHGFRLATAAFACLAICATAFADIKAYNAAIGRGDYAVAASEAEGVWQKFDKTLPEAAVTAREFAWISMLAGQPEKARVYARFLVEQGATLPKPDEDPLLSKVLLHWAEIGDKPSKEARAAFSAALAAWSATNSPLGSRIGAVSAVHLYGKAWQAGDWKDTERDAKIAETLSTRLGAEGIVLRQRAIVDGGAANFMETRKADGWLRLADAWDNLVTQLPPPRPGEGLDLGELEPTYWRGLAWMEAMSSYFSFGENSLNTSMAFKRQGNLIEQRAKTLKSRCGDQECAFEKLAPDALPRCDARWDQTPQLKYPPMAVFKGIVGATILRLTVNEAGKVTEAKLLAAVPSDTFPDAALGAVYKWTLKPTGATKEKCTVAGTRELVVRFQLM